MKFIGYGILAACAFMSGIGSTAAAQEYRQQSIVVTGARISTPGVYLKRQGDFLIIDVIVASDSRDYALRRTEIETTVDALLAQANDYDDISISIDVNGLIYPLESTEELPLSSGSRPDTSVANLVLRTPIPQDISNIQPLVQRLEQFASLVEGEGRATVDTRGGPTVSVVDPDQYRGEVIDLILEEVEDVTSTLGNNYRVILSGIDGRMQWQNTDNVNVIFYIPYNYTVIPTSLTTVLPDY